MYSFVLPVLLSRTTLLAKTGTCRDLAKDNLYPLLSLVCSRAKVRFGWYRFQGEPDLAQLFLHRLIRERLRGGRKSNLDGSSSVRRYRHWSTDNVTASIATQHWPILPSCLRTTVLHYSGVKISACRCAVLFPQDEQDRAEAVPALSYP